MSKKTLRITIDTMFLCVFGIALFSIMFLIIQHGWLFGIVAILGLSPSICYFVYRYILKK